MQWQEAQWVLWVCLPRVASLRQGRGRSGSRLGGGLLGGSKPLPVPVPGLVSVFLCRELAFYPTASLISTWTPLTLTYFMEKIKVLCRGFLDVSISCDT